MVQYTTVDAAQNVNNSSGNFGFNRADELLLFVVVVVIFILSCLELSALIEVDDDDD